MKNRMLIISLIIAFNFITCAVHKPGFDPSVSRPPSLIDPLPVLTGGYPEGDYEGTVILKVSINKSGQPELVEVMHSLGPGPLSTAMDLIRGRQFYPALKDSHAVRSVLILAVQFVLSGGESIGGSI